MIIPWLYFVVRYIQIRYRRDDCLKYKGDRRVKKELEYLDWLISKDLMYWEIKTFLFDALGILYKIGAIHQLKEELEKLKDFQKEYKYMRLQSYIYSLSHKFPEMTNLLKHVMNDKRISPTEKRRTINNLYHAYTTAGDTEGQDSIFPLIEKESIVSKSFFPETFDILLYRYDYEGESSKDKIEKLINAINSTNIKSFNSYLKFMDTLYAYYKRNDMRDEAIKLLDGLGEKAVEMHLSEEDLLIVLLRLVKSYIELNYRWEEITLVLFNRARFFLSYSRKVAIEFMKMTLTTIECAEQLYSRYIDKRTGELLYSKISKYIAQYISDFKNAYINEDDRLLYMKREYIRSLFVYYRLQACLNLQFVQYGDNIERLGNKFIGLCRKNEETSELIHALTTFIDEEITFEKCINRAINRGIAGTDAVRAKQKLASYRVSANKNLEELYSILDQFNFDRACAYSTLWASYFMLYYGDRERAKFLFDKFEQHNISVKNYGIRVQRTYQDYKRVIYCEVNDADSSNQSSYV